MLESTLALDETQDKMEQTQLDLVNGSASSRGVDTQFLKAVVDQSAMDWAADVPSSMTGMRNKLNDITRSLTQIGEGVVAQASSLKPPSRVSSLTSVATNVELTDSDAMGCACQLDVRNRHHLSLAIINPS